MWFVSDLLTNLQSINITTLKPILINMLVVIIFSVTFIILNNLVAKKKQKVG